MKLSRFIPVSGIYKICNTKNGKVYIGQAKNIRLRWSSHVDELVSNKHCNKDLLEDFQRYGFEVFTVELIEKCKPDKDVLLSRERYWISQYCKQGIVLYNRHTDKFWYVENEGKNYSEIMSDNAKRQRDSFAKG